MEKDMRPKLKAIEAHLVQHGSQHAIMLRDPLRLSICTGDAEALFQGVKEEQDRRRICGLPPIYLTLRYLDGAKGEVSGYM
jgi:hypothetical protein